VERTAWYGLETKSSEKRKHSVAEAKPGRESFSKALGGKSACFFLRTLLKVKLEARHKLRLNE
jgi:hypothetical protein